MYNSLVPNFQLKKMATTSNQILTAAEAYQLIQPLLKLHPSKMGSTEVSALGIYLQTLQQWLNPSELNKFLKILDDLSSHVFFKSLKSALLMHELQATLPVNSSAERAKTKL